MCAFLITILILSCRKRTSDFDTLKVIPVHANRVKGGDLLLIVIGLMIEKLVIDDLLEGEDEYHPVRMMMKKYLLNQIRQVSK